VGRGISLIIIEILPVSGTINFEEKKLIWLIAACTGEREIKYLK